MLVYTGISPFRRNNFNNFIVSIGLSTTPIHDPFTNTFVTAPKYSGLHSCNSRNDVLARNHFIKGFADVPLVISVLIDMCLCKPIFPPSGVSTGSIYPHCDACNNLGPTTFALASNGKLIFLS